MKKLFTLTVLVSVFTFNSFAQTGNMWTDYGYGQNILTQCVDGNFIWFGTDFGLVKYNKVTGDKQFITRWNTLFASFSDLICVLGSNGTSYSTPKALTVDASGNLYAIICGDLYRYDGFTWQSYGFLFTSEDEFKLQYTTDNKIWIFDYMDGISGAFVFCEDLSTQQTISPVSNNWGVYCVMDNGDYWSLDDSYSYTSYDFHVIKYDGSGNQIDERYLTATVPTLDGGLLAISEDSNGNLIFLTNELSPLLGVNNGSSDTYYPLLSSDLNVWNRFDALTSSTGATYFLSRPVLTSFPLFTYNDHSSLLKFQNGVITEYDSTLIGTPYHRFMNMSLDANNNLWLSCGNHNNRSIEENVFKKTPSDVWSRFYLNDLYMPGSPDISTVMGNDSTMKTYINEGNCVSIIDSNMNISLLQVTDSLYYGGYSAMNYAGDIWRIFKPSWGSPWTLNKVTASGTLTNYPNTPFVNGYIECIKALNNKVFIDRSDGQGNRNIFYFDGVVWDSISNSGLPVNIVINNLDAVDPSNGNIWFEASDTVTASGLLLVKYDGTTNTVYSYTDFPTFGQVPMQLTPDGLGNVWFIENDKLIRWDEITLTEFTPPANILLQGNQGGYGYDPSIWFFDGVPYFYSRPFPLNSTDFQITKFDGTNWTTVTFPFEAIFHSNNITTLPNIAKCGSKFIFTLGNELLIYDPAGNPNLPMVPFNTVAGKIFYDLNSNNVYDNGDVESDGIAIQSDIYSTLSDYDGNYQLNTDTGMQNIHAIEPPYYISNPANTQYNFGDTVSQGIANINFALQPIPGINDLTIDITKQGFHPGAIGTYYLYCHNAGTTLQNPIVSFTFDSLFTYSFSSITPTGINGNTVFYDLGALSPLQSSTVTVHLSVPTSATSGTSVTALAMINPVANDTTPLNNSITFNHIITTSFDPNAKEVSPAGIGSSHIIDTTQELIYTIFFQNTGTDTAFNVLVYDTLDADLDISTFKFMASSHQAQIDFLNPNTLEFIFNNILLPCSSDNEPESHGFVKYSIKPKSNSAYGNTIKNKASIYFDYNSPIVTNTTTNTLGNPNSVFELSDANQMQLLLYPNPNNGEFEIEISDYKVSEKFKLEVTDCEGKILKTVFFKDNKISVDCKDFSSGTYLVKIFKGEKIVGVSKYVLIK